MISKYTTFFLIFTSLFSFSQQHKIDSLKIEIKKNEFNYDAYNDIVRLIANSKPDTVIIIGKKMIEIGKTKNDMILEGLGYKNIAKGLQNKDEYEEARKSLKKSIAVLKNKNAYFYGTVLIEYANILQYLESYKNAYDTLNIAENYIINEKNVFRKNYSLYLLNSLKGYNFKKFGLYEDAVKYNLEALNNCKKLKDVSPRIALSNLGGIYTDLYKKDKAIYYYSLLIKECDKTKDKFTKYITYANISRMYRTFYDFDKADENIEKCLKLYEEINGNKDYYSYYLFKASIFRERKQYKKAIEYCNYVLKNANPQNQYQINEAKTNLGHAYFQSKDYNQAKKYYDAVLPYYKKNKDYNSINYILLSYTIIEAHLNNPKKVEKTIREYDSIKNIIFNESSANSIEGYELKYQTAQKEAKIKTQQLQIQKEKTNKYFAFGGVGLLVLTLIVGLVWIKNKQAKTQLKTQNTLLILQQNLNAMQLDNLNKQLDPHEIKNILANISPEIQRKAPEAYDKMTKLLNLTSASLSTNSITDSIENQLKQVDDYLSLEQNVLSVLLNYTIKNTVDTSKQIPRLLLKNLVENAIKHGIKNKKEGGDINIALSEIDNKIKITVDDTGIGRQHAISHDSGIGTTTYINLFETLNKTNSQKASFNIIDKHQGTKIEVVIPIDYKYV